MTPRRSRRTNLGLCVLAFGLVALLAGCSRDGRPLTTLDPAGQASSDIHTLVVPVFIVAGIVFVIINVGVVVIAVKFRRRKDVEEDFPVQIHGNTKLELGWTIVPALIMAAIAVGTVATIFRIWGTPAGAAQDLHVTVVGQQWWWAFEYDVNGDGQVDFTTANEMVIPVGTPVTLTLTARDVIHSFWIPALHGKHDAVPGREHPWWIQADEPGRYLGQCTEYCGLSHAWMRMLVDARPADDFEQWVQGQLEPAQIPAEADAAARRGLEVFVGQCATCHLIEGVNSPECTPIEDEAAYDEDANTCWVGAAPFAGAAQESGAAPDLTHLMSRYTFVGAVYELRNEETGALNVNELKGWIRNPADYKAMSPEPDRGTQFGRGMPALPLTEDQLDDLVAYLATLD